jgi:hypothetical protein
MPNKRRKSESINLFRGGYQTTSYLGSFSSSLSEVRITAALGYIISRESELFIPKFNLKGLIESIELERNELDGRSDLCITTTGGVTIVEAKCSITDPIKQAHRYLGNHYILLTNYRPLFSQFVPQNTKYLNWEEIASILRKCQKSKNKDIRFCSTDLITYMETHHMVKNQNVVEIYARDLNDEATVDLFLKAQLYGCPFEKDTRVTQAKYFAPCFDQSVVEQYPGIQHGISYIAKIESIEVVATWSDFEKVIYSNRKGWWLRQNKKYLEPIRNEWTWDGSRKHTFLFLGKPHLAFNPPIKKVHIKKGTGFLGKLYLSFDKLYEAWGK